MIRRAFLAWLNHYYPPCPLGCGHRARGWRTLADHVELEHAGDEGVGL